MEDLARAAINFWPLILSGIMPLVRVLRGRSLGRSFLLCWVLFVLFLFLSTSCIPHMLTKT